MLKNLCPYACADSVFSLDYRKIYDLGYRGIIFDIDCTLVPHGNDSTEKIDALFRHIHEIGLKTLLLSNNDEERVTRFIKNIDTLYICDADKPKPAAYNKALKMLNIRREEALYAGDQLFTDILGANRSGIKSILVKFICHENETNIGRRRKVEKIILRLYHLNPSNRNRIGDIFIQEDKKMFGKKRKRFCDINPTCYAISLEKEIIKRHLKDLLGHEKFAQKRTKKTLPNVVSEHDSELIKRGKGIDIRLQENKAVNIKLACGQMDHMIIYPGEVFSFWKTVGKTTKRKGYLEGRVIQNNKIIPGMGGGLCNLANTLHLLVLHSPLDVVEFHHHSDALAPDKGKRVPFSAGTSVSYNNVDYRFKNNTDQPVQLLLWCENDKLYGEIRSRKPFPYRYELIEEDHHFRKEGEKYYRVSKIYRNVIDRKTDQVAKKELILDNHSEVMFDYDLIPQELIWND